MGVKGSITLTPREMPAFLQKLASDLVDIDQQSFFKQVGIALENGATDCFNQSKTPDGQPWSPLKHPRPRGGTKPLLDRGLLRGSLTNNGNGHVERISGNVLEWGTNLESALIHNYGGVVVPKKGKFLAIPASVEAQRAGSPRNFPDAKRRLKWYINKDGTKGYVYEIPKKNKKNPRIAGKSSKRGSKFAKSISRGMKRLKRFGKKLSRLSKKGMRALRRSLAKVKRLSKKVMQLQKKLRAAGLSYKAAQVLRDALKRTTKQLREAKSNHLKLKAGKLSKSGANKQNSVWVGNKLIHYFLTKRVEIPAREFIGISDNTADVILAIAEDQIANNAGG